MVGEAGRGTSPIVLIQSDASRNRNPLRDLLLRKQTLLISGAIGLLVGIWFVNFTIGWQVRSSSESRIARANTILLNRRPNEAVTELTWLLKYDPKNSKARFALGRAYLEMKKYQSAIDAFSTIPEDSALYRLASINAAKCYINSAKMDLAEQVLRKLLAIYPNSEEARTELQWLYFNQFRLREFQELLIQGLPHSTNRYLLLYHLLAMESKPPIAQESIRVLKQIDEAQPGQISITLALGNCYWKLGKTEIARGLIEKSRNINSDHLEAFLVAAEFYLELGDLEKCKAFFQPQPKNHSILRQKTEKDDRWHWLVSRYYFQQNDHRNALESIRIALKLNPKEIKYVQHLGIVLQSMGKSKTAYEHFQQVKVLAKSRRELYMIFSSGALENPTPELCLQIAFHCNVLGKGIQAREWTRLASVIQQNQS